MQMGSWSQLPSDLVLKVVERLNAYEDRCSFQAVCTPWRHALKESSMLLHHSPLPWLMLPYCEGEGDQHGSDISCHRNRFCRGFFSISENKVYHLEFPKAYEKHCCGSSYGWLIMVDNSNPSIFLLNPVTGRRIELPPMTTFPDILNFQPNKVGEEYHFRCGQYTRTWSSKDIASKYLHKVILSSDPTTLGCIVVAICAVNGCLALCRPGDKEWTIIGHTHEAFFHDGVFWRNKLYAVDMHGSGVVCDAELPFPKKKPFLKHQCWIPGLKYLAVHPSRNLLMIARRMNWDSNPLSMKPYNTIGFEIYRLDKRTMNWKKVDDLGDCILFLGVNSAVCLLATDFPVCRADCIYFTDDYAEGHQQGRPRCYDLGIFSLKDGSIKRFPCCPDESRLIWPPPVWVTL